MEKTQKLCGILGILFLLSYGFYVAGVSDSIIFKYFLVTGLIFLTIDIILIIILAIKQKKKQTD